MRCTGQCCKEVIMQTSPRDLLYFITRYERGGNPLDRDNAYIGGMLTRIREDDYPNKESPDTYLYKCKHFNTKTNNCMAYELRPKMCSDFPYGNVCEHPGCTNTDKGVPVNLN